MKKIKNQAIVRTSDMRMLLSSEQRAELDVLNHNHQMVANRIQQTVYGFSGRILDHKKGGIVVDGSGATQEQIMEIYNPILNWKYPSAGLTNPLLAVNFKNTDKIAKNIAHKQIEYDKLKKIGDSNMSAEEKQKHKKKLKSVADKLEYSTNIMHLANQRIVGNLPIPLSAECRSHLENNYKQDVVKGWKGRFDSWKENDVATKKKYEENEEKLITHASELSKLYGSNIISELNDLITAVKSLGERYTDISYLNYKFLSFFTECWRPYAIANNTGLLKGYWLAKDNRSHKLIQVEYQFNSKVNDELFRRKSLWAPDKCILADPTFKEYVELYNAHFRHRKQASLTLISNESPIPIGFSMDHNAAKLKSIKNDKANCKLTITIELPSGDERSYTASYRKKKNTKCYYNDLEVRLPRTEKDLMAIAKKENRKLTDKEILEASLKNCYVFEYTRQGKIPIFATVKTLYIRRNPNNGEYYIVLPTNIYTDYHTNNQFMSTELFKIRSLLQTSWKEVRRPTIRNKQTCKLDKDICKLLNGRTLRYAGIDLGYNNPYTITYYNVIGKNNSIQWKETGTEIISTIPNEQYNQLRQNMQRLVDIIRMSRQYLQSKEEIKITDKNIKNFDRLMALLPDEQHITYTQYINTLETYKERGLLAKDLKRVWDKINGKWIKRNDVWIVCDLMYFFTQTMNRIRGNRNANNQLTGQKEWLSAPVLIELIDTYYNLRKTFNDSGDGIKSLPKDHIYVEGEKRRLTIKEEDFCKGILEWRDNIKDSFIKKLFSQLVHRCHELGVGIVAMENLEILGSVKNTKWSNRMYNIWPRGKMKESAENAFEYMGILIQYVDENGTSQHDADTGVRGWRDGNDLWLPGEIKKHADGNASKMIALRGLTHHTNLYKRKLTNVGNGYYVNAYEFMKTTKDRNNDAPRLRGAESRLNGYSATVYQISHDGGMSVVPDLNATKIIDGKDIRLTKENTATYYKMNTTNTYYPWSVVKTFEENAEKKLMQVKNS